MTEQRMKLSFKDIASSDAYQAQASSWCKAHIFVALAAAIATTWFGDVSLGWHWVWVFPAILFGASFLVALPTMAVYVWIVSVQSGHMQFAPPATPSPADSFGRVLNFVKSVWSILSLALNAYAAYHFVNAVSS